jgi:hypothetical protein
MKRDYVDRDPFLASARHDVRISGQLRDNLTAVLEGSSLYVESSSDAFREYSLALGWVLRSQ